MNGFLRSEAHLKEWASQNPDEVIKNWERIFFLKVSVWEIFVEGETINYKQGRNCSWSRNRSRRKI